MLLCNMIAICNSLATGECKDLLCTIVFVQYNYNVYIHIAQKQLFNVNPVPYVPCGPCLPCLREHMERGERRKRRDRRDRRERRERRDRRERRERRERRDRRDRRERGERMGPQGRQGPRGQCFCIAPKRMRMPLLAVRMPLFAQSIIILI